MIAAHPDDLPRTGDTMNEVLAVIERERITVFYAGPTVYVILLNRSERHRYDLTSLRITFLTTSTMPLGVAQRWRERVGLPIIEGYVLIERRRLPADRNLVARLLQLLAPLETRDGGRGNRERGTRDRRCRRPRQRPRRRRAGGRTHRGPTRASRSPWVRPGCARERPP